MSASNRYDAVRRLHFLDAATEADLDRMLDLIGKHVPASVVLGRIRVVMEPGAMLADSGFLFITDQEVSRVTETTQGTTEVAYWSGGAETFRHLAPAAPEQGDAA